MGPLQGIKVIDMTTVLMGPYATQMLGDYGADVIKVESIEGDVTRLIGPTRHPGMGPVFLNTNRSKRSICLDLKKPVGAICASLVHRDRLGRGQRLDIPMFETMTSFVMGDHMGGLTYDPPLDKGGYARHLSRDRRPYKTSDGYICVIVYNDKQWQSFFDATGRDDLRNDPKFATFAGRATNIDEVYAELARIFKTRTTADWLALLTKADIPVMPMHDLETILDDPHLVATGYFPIVEHPTEGPIRSMKVSAAWSETPVETVRLAPRLNEHGEEILREAGFSSEEIATLVRDGVTRAPA
jgi:crotonobetainyl-CoA:carnitine CoA-transferase CaiB-like acyl-CoA transferase